MPVMDGLTATRAIRAWEQRERQAANTNHRTDGLCLEGGSRNVPGSRVHGLFDETNQTRGAAASDQGALTSRASVIKRGK